jgi:hypothetical protein
VELAHDYNLGDARAVFYGQEEQEGADPFPPVELSAKVVGCCESSQPTTFSASRASVYSPNFLEVWNSRRFASGPGRCHPYKRLERVICSLRAGKRYRKEPHPMSTPEENKAQCRRTYEEWLRLYKFPV